MPTHGGPRGWQGTFTRWSNSLSGTVPVFVCSTPPVHPHPERAWRIVSICLLTASPSLTLSVYLSLFLSSLSLCLCLSLCLSLTLSTSLSLSLPSSVSVSLPFSPSLCLCVFLSLPPSLPLPHCRRSIIEEIKACVLSNGGQPYWRQAAPE